MVLVLVELAEHEEKERSHVPIEVFVVEEELREVAEVLAIDRVLEPVDLEHLN